MYHYTDSGLDNVHLTNGYIERETQYGKSVAIHDLEGLHRLIGTNIAEASRVISGPEFRFLRIELDLSQNALATLMDIGESSVRNWEKSRVGVPGPAAAVLRRLYLESINHESQLRPLLENISKLNRELHHAKLELEETESGWRLAA